MRIIKLDKVHKEKIPAKNGIYEDYNVLLSVNMHNGEIRLFYSDKLCDAINKSEEDTELLLEKAGYKIALKISKIVADPKGFNISEILKIVERNSDIAMLVSKVLDDNEAVDLFVFVTALLNGEVDKVEKSAKNLPAPF